MRLPPADHAHLNDSCIHMFSVFLSPFKATKRTQHLYLNTCCTWVDCRCYVTCVFDAAGTFDTECATLRILSERFVNNFMYSWSMATPKEKQNSCLQFHKIFFPVPTEKCVKITIPKIKSKKRRLSTGNIRSKPDKPVHFRQVRSKIFLIVKFLSRLELQHVLKRPRYHHKKGLVWLVFKILLEQKKYMYIKSARILKRFWEPFYAAKQTYG